MSMTRPRRRLPTRLHGGLPWPTACAVALLGLLPATAPAARAQDAGRDEAASRETVERRVGRSEMLPDGEIRRLLESGEVTGLSIALARDGEVDWVGSFGTADEATGEAVARETLFQAASLSKPVFAYAVLRLAERGELDLDAPVADLLPNERMAHDERYLRITPRMILSHSTGLPNWGGDRLELAFDPGAGYRYSGEGYVYLQRAVSKATGLSLDELVRREAFEPLGMTSSGFVWHDAFEGRLAAGHEEDGESLGPRKPEGEGNAAASLVTTAEDYARFLVALMEGRGLRQGTLEDALSPQVAVARADREPVEGLHWSLGWGLQQGPAGRALWHWGHNDGFRNYVVAYPDHGEALVYFANSDHGLAIVRDVLALAAETGFLPADEHAAVAYLDYEQHDDPRRIVRRSLLQTFEEEGIDAGLRLHARLRSERPGVVDERLTNSLGYALLGDREAEAAIAVFRRNAEDHPESANVWDSLGEGLLTAARYPEALESYERSVELNPENENGKRALAWIREAIEAIERRPAIPRAPLEAYVGDYGPRHVRLDAAGSGLLYQSDGSPEHRLIPISEDTFLLEGVGTARMRFVREGPGPATKIEGLYWDGSTDETERT